MFRPEQYAMQIVDTMSNKSMPNSASKVKRSNSITKSPNLEMVNILLPLHPARSLRIVRAAGQHALPALEPPGIGLLCVTQKRHCSSPSSRRFGHARRARRVQTHEELLPLLRFVGKFRGPGKLSIFSRHSRTTRASSFISFADEFEWKGGVGGLRSWTMRPDWRWRCGIMHLSLVGSLEGSLEKGWNVVGGVSIVS
ncbi:hypothetical protein EJ02DRAFT_41898 [Clathrospora elynae]|uniref:Uncharacterized protein n=1 Tax=Clathrospora elynae TaxID=706981 RepID=A0A6A5SKE1_9PLEO|nr:hypothetical protein EJ02DRAFT_41898 [Clathrospora elynae]